MEQKNVLTTGLLVKEMPPVILDLNNGQGTFLYNHNIQEVDLIEDEGGALRVATTDKDKADATGKGYLYDSVRVEYPKTADNIYGTLLSAKYPANTESKLQNEYNSAVLRLLDEAAKEPYVAFLSDRLVIRKMVDDDCANYNIPNDL